MALQFRKTILSLIPGTKVGAGVLIARATLDSNFSSGSSTEPLPVQEHMGMSMQARIYLFRPSKAPNPRPSRHFHRFRPRFSRFSIRYSSWLRTPHNPKKLLRTKKCTWGSEGTRSPSFALGSRTNRPPTLRRPTLHNSNFHPFNKISRAVGGHRVLLRLRMRLPRMY